MRNAGLEEAQAEIKIAGRNINNLRYAVDTSLMAKSEEELKSLLMKVKVESEKVGSKINIHYLEQSKSGDNLMPINGGVNNKNKHIRMMEQSAAVCYNREEPQKDYAE